jgi:hypothetical protein
MHLIHIRLGTAFQCGTKWRRKPIRIDVSHVIIFENTLQEMLSNLHEFGFKFGVIIYFGR